ncbi:phosphoribosylformylglycinamidine synthase subunit PurL [Candidatus Woesearchaeota archaeon]|nr:phosphoribosylformylglycinamidine synthase subunit PurL [Candidatus Woesearchaeota archaeon]
MWIEIKTKETSKDVRKEGLQKAINEDLGLKAEVAETSDIYVIQGSYSTKEAETIARAMSDQVVQQFGINNQLYSKGAWVAIVRYKPQITDPVEQSTLKLVEDIGLAAESATIMQKYAIRNATEEQVKAICEGLLANENTQQYGYGFEHVNVSSFLKRETAAAAENGEPVAAVKIRKASDAELRKISQKNVLSLSLEEMKAIQTHFKKLRREPTDAELETIAQTWSEHCKHKTFNSEIGLELYDGGGKKTTETISNLFRETIVAATNEIAKRKEWKDNLISVFRDNAGIIKFDEENCIAFKVETHNHPSALDPYGGAGTGIGGVIRDVLGAGLGAKPIFSTDVFCFANPDYNEKLPKGVLHPKRTLKGVVSGVRDYGNRMGIPTINGSITFHNSYLAPLVYCGTAGIMPRWAIKKSPKPGDLIVVVGGKTGKDGLHGATFSSTELNEGLTTSVVQIGNAIEEKKMLDTILEARDRKLFNAITDCGAGGFSSAVGEMGRELGAEVELSQVPLKHSGMKPWEIWLSESQERMVVSVPEKNLQKLKEICEKEGAGIAVIGSFTATKKLVVKHNGKTAAELSMDFLHNGLPKQKRKAVYREKKAKTQQKQLQRRKLSGSNYDETLMKLLGMPSIASKELVIRQYDHEVQANTIIKPLTGAANDRPSDASVVMPVFGSRKGLAVANGINPRYGIISPYWMAAAAIDEALRNIVATGGSLGKTAILDNFCWANTDEPERLGTLVMAAKACKDFATAYGTPFISGKDSLHNEVVSDGKKIPILDTLLISAVAVIDDVDDIVTMDIKKEGSSIYAIGETKDEMGGSHYSELVGLGLESGNVPTIDAAKSKATFAAVEEAIKEKIVLACHDISEGGMAVALTEMCFAGGIGAEVELRNVPHTKPFYEKAQVEQSSTGSSRQQSTWGLSKNGGEIVLFSESQTRFIAEVEKGKEAMFEGTMKKHGCHYGMIGKTKGKHLVIRGSAGKIIDADIKELKEAWQKTLRY